MENERSDKSSDEPNPKRPKIESAGSTSAKPESKEPFLSLPPDVLSKIIGYIPVAQWSSLELLDKHFRTTTYMAYRQLRNVNLGRDFIMKSRNESSIGNSINSILLKLVERSPFLISIGGMHLRADAVPLLAQFEHLQSISLGDGQFFTNQEGIQLENVVAFLESTRSRTSLKELRLYNVAQRYTRFSWRDTPILLDLFATSFASGCHIRSPWKLEKFSFESSNTSLRIRLDTMDTTRLTDVRLRSASIEPQQLTSLIERSPKLRRIELLLGCGRHGCNYPRLEANKKLLVALSTCENLTALKFYSIKPTHCVCTNFVPEFVEMLKTVGHRGQLRKLAIDDKLFNHASTINKDEICATISAYVQCLQSIKLHIGRISDGNIFSIVGMPELEELDLLHSRITLTANIIKKIAQSPSLKRLALHRLRGDEDPNSYKYLADITTLRDLRIGDTSRINAGIWEKWSDSFASNLECLMVDEIENEVDMNRVLKKAVNLRVLILQGNITDQSMMAIAKSCPNLETFGVRSYSYRNRSAAGVLREVVNSCPKLNRLGGFTQSAINSLRLEKFHRKIVRDLDVDFWKYDFDDVYE